VIVSITFTSCQRSAGKPGPLQSVPYYSRARPKRSGPHNAGRPQDPYSSSRATPYRNRSVYKPNSSPENALVRSHHTISYYCLLYVIEYTMVTAYEITIDLGTTYPGGGGGGFGGTALANGDAKSDTPCRGNPFSRNDL
jgi:hypothetical protein